MPLNKETKPNVNSKINSLDKKKPILISRYRHINKHQLCLLAPDWEKLEIVHYTILIYL